MMGNDTYVRRKIKNSRSVSAFLEKVFLEQKLNNWFGWLFIALIAIGFGYLVATKTFLGLGLFGVILGFFLIIGCLVSTELGLYINVLYSYFAFHFSRYFFHDEFPVGVVTDILILAAFLSLLFTNIKMKKAVNEFTKTSVVIFILILLGYLFLEFFNPLAHSFEGWFQTFRRFLGSVLLLFIAYNTFTSYQKIKRFIIVLFILNVVAALYGCIQQWHGLFDFEIAWVISSPNRYGIFFQMGDFRKFSTMSDPTAFGVAMASSAVFFMIYAWYQKKISFRIMLWIGIIFMLVAMGYSGTRTANVMVAAGIVMFVLLTLNKKPTRIFAVVAGMVFLVLLYGPYTNRTINRFRTSFIGTKDESFNVRERNRKFIQPYMYKHPFGGGVGTVGASGKKYNPGHYLAGFPPDSGYLRKALETGWIGLLIVCLLYYVVLKFGIQHYFRCKNEDLKIIYAGAIAAIFSFYLAEFAQEAIGQITDIVIYYPLLAMLLKMKHFKSFNQTAPEQEEITA
jgi:putative inorganic carbon (hco3(-)) transporter